MNTTQQPGTESHNPNSGMSSRVEQQLQSLNSELAKTKAKLTADAAKLKSHVVDGIGKVQDQRNAKRQQLGAAVSVRVTKWRDEVTRLEQQAKAASATEKARATAKLADAKAELAGAKAEFHAHVDAVLAESNDEVQLLEARAANAEAQAKAIKAKATASLAELRTKRDALKAKATALKGASERAYDDTKMGLDNALADLANARHAATSEFR